MAIKRVLVTIKEGIEKEKETRGERGISHYMVTERVLVIIKGSQRREKIWGGGKGLWQLKGF
jgi:hypothetical protein